MPVHSIVTLTFFFTSLAMRYMLSRSFHKLHRIVKQRIFERQREAAAKIQNTYRSFVARTAYRRMVAYRNTQARHIQRLVRGAWGRMYSDQYRIVRTRHALLSQRLVRGWYGRKRGVIIMEEIRLYRLWWDSFVISIQRQVRTKLRRQKWEYIIALANQRRAFLARMCQKYIRGMLGRIKAKRWITKWRYDCPTPLLFSTPKCAIFNYEFSHVMYSLQQHIILISGDIQRVYRGHVGRGKATQRRIAVHWAKSAVIKMRFLVGRKHRRQRQAKYNQQHYSLTQLQSEYRRYVAAIHTYDHRTEHYQQERQQKIALTVLHSKGPEVERAKGSAAGETQLKRCIQSTPSTQSIECTQSTQSTLSQSTLSTQSTQSTQSTLSRVPPALPAHSAHSAQHLVHPAHAINPYVVATTDWAARKTAWTAWNGEQIGASLLIQHFFRSEQRRLVDPFVRTRRRHRAVLMFQTLYRGYKEMARFVIYQQLCHYSASKIQIFYKSYSANMRWRGISRKIMQRCMEHLKKVKAMNLVLANSRQNIELEQGYQEVAAGKIENRFKRYYKNNQYVKQMKIKNKAVQKRIEMHGTIENIHLQSSTSYKVKSFFAPKHFPKSAESKSEKTAYGNALDGTTKEELYRVTIELKESEEELAAAIAMNTMLRKETQKYHQMRRDIEKTNQNFVDRVHTYEVSLMDELQATSELYELHYNPVVREVEAMEANLLNTLRISCNMFQHLNVMDPIDIRRLQLKSTDHIRTLLPFKYLDLVEFEQLIDNLTIQYFNINDVICEEGDDGVLDPTTRNYYIIADGTCCVSKYNSDLNRNVNLAELTIGHGFGEQSLIREDGKRTATVTATSKMMTFVLHSALFRSLISDRSWKVIQYELAKFDKINLRLMNRLNKFQEQEQKKSDLEQMEVLKEELERSARKQRNKIKRHQRKTRTAESVSIVLGALDEAITRRSRAVKFKNGPATIVRQAIQEALLLYQHKMWGTMDEEEEEVDTVEGKKTSVQIGQRSQVDAIVTIATGEQKEQKVVGGAGAIQKVEKVDERKEEGQWQVEDIELQDTLTLWDTALETGRSMNSELLDQIETMSETSLGSYGYGLGREDAAMLRVAEFELLHMSMGNMHRLGMFEDGDLDVEFEGIEQQIWVS